MELEITTKNWTNIG